MSTVRQLWRGTMCIFRTDERGRVEKLLEFDQCDWPNFPDCLIRMTSEADLFVRRLWDESQHLDELVRNGSTLTISISMLRKDSIDVER